MSNNIDKMIDEIKNNKTEEAKKSLKEVLIDIVKNKIRKDTE